MSAADFCAERFWLRKAERSTESSRRAAAWRGQRVSWAGEIWVRHWRPERVRCWQRSLVTVERDKSLWWCWLRALGNMRVLVSAGFCVIFLVLEDGYPGWFLCKSA